MNKSDGTLYLKCLNCGEFVLQAAWDEHRCEDVQRAYRFPLTRVIEANMIPRRKFYHLRDWKHLKGEPIEIAMTVCVVKDDTGMLQNRTVYSRGISYMLIGDQFDRPLGRKIARGRALKALETREHRVARLRDPRMIPTYVPLAKEYGLPTIMDVPVRGIEDESIHKNTKPSVLFTCRYDVELTEFEKRMWTEKCPSCGKWTFGPCPECICREGK